MDSTAPRTDSLARWLVSWVNADGGIHGFHNHSVWGTNPATFLDFTSGHTAFSAPLLGSLAQLLAAHPDERGVQLWRRMMLFQAADVYPDGQFRHVGFQVGESSTRGLIHSAVASIGLLTGLRHGRDLLSDAEAEGILSTVRRSLDGLTSFGGGRPTIDGVCNQEYARVWAKLLYTELSGDGRWAREIPEDLDALIERHHHRGVPDADSSGTFRSAHARTTGGLLEPAEYYGLEIIPLVLASQRYGEPRYLDEAARLARHVVRSAWHDDEGRMRFHRHWYVTGERALKSEQPMLIAGMGLTLHGIVTLLRAQSEPAPELRAFVDACVGTYSHYQTPAGYFASATGWHNEADVAPSTSWHAHDLLFLADYLPPDDLSGDFWDTVFTPHAAQSVLTTDRATWIEHGVHWAILSPFTAGDLALYGRKDRGTFERDFFASWTDLGPLPDELRFDTPLFVVAEGGIHRIDDGTEPVEVTVLGGLEYRGRLRGSPARQFSAGRPSGMTPEP